MIPKFRTRLFGPFGPMAPPIPVRHQGIREIRNLFILWIIKDEKEGIYAYQLQEQYNIPRGNLLRILNSLEKEGYVKSKEKIVKGRAQKLYFITDKGVDYLNQLREKWSERFAIMQDITTPLFGHFIPKEPRFRLFLENVERFVNKKDAIEYFKKLRERFEEHYEKIKKRLNNIEFTKDRIDELLKKLEETKDYTPSKLRELLKNMKNKFKEHYSNVKFCKICGTELPDGALYCPECGNRI
ncbi:MAG: helix-turn-helix transcriptional regulator [Candidatus Helarchaeota archaeon]